MDLKLKTAASRRRQRRLQSAMHEMQLDYCVVMQREHVQWLTGEYFAWHFQPSAALFADGRCLLVAPSTKSAQEAAADEVVPYDAQWHSTLRNDQRAESSARLLDALKTRNPKQGGNRRVGVEYSSFCPHLAQGIPAEFVDIEPQIFYLRRRKEPDELALIRKAIASTGRMYEKAREIIAPGINELEVFNQLQAAAVQEFGEPPTATGNDYACGQRGGPPRDRKAEDGELYILDLGPAYRGYFADNCRTIAVNGRPTDEQHAAWKAVSAVFPLVEQTVRPGVNCRQFFSRVQEMMDAASCGVFDHHLGHGIGLFPHEAPHLNPNWNDTFEAGDVFTVEPGLYAPELRAGIRLENDYLVSEDGVELLTDFPLGLV